MLKNTVYSASSLEQQPERDSAPARLIIYGRCGRCGQQCFHVKRTGRFQVRFTSRPLTIPKLVRNGRCLHCHPEAMPAAPPVVPLATPVPAPTGGGHSARGGDTRTGTWRTGKWRPAAAHTSTTTPPSSHPREQPAPNWVALAVYTAVCVLAGFGLAL